MAGMACWPPCDKMVFIYGPMNRRAVAGQSDGLIGLVEFVWVLIDVFSVHGCFPADRLSPDRDRPSDRRRFRGQLRLAVHNGMIGLGHSIGRLSRREL